MKLKDQVCTLAQARELKKLGITAPAYFSHILNTHLPSDCHIRATHETTSWRINKKLIDSGVIGYYPAFTVAELGVMLTGELLPAFNTKVNEWASPYPVPCMPTEAQARGAQLIWLLANERTTPAEVNARSQG